jgi:predicted nuclease with RNAse H fold
VTPGTDQLAVVAIGWDVRGWRSRDQAVAVLAFDAPSGPPEWLGISGQFQLATGEPLGLSALIEPATGKRLDSASLMAARVVVGIDAPLAFPRRFIELLGEGGQSMCCPPNKEIDNAFAYRDCERWIHERFSKKPLSATFDKLGNNATLALCMARSLNQQGYDLVPQQAASSRHALIEVYPGIAKRGRKKTDRAIRSVEQHIPPQLVPGSDQYDAAVCAILAATFAGKGRALGLPDLTGPESGYDPREGWIYGLPADFVRREADE